MWYTLHRITLSKPWLWIFEADTSRVIILQSICFPCQHYWSAQSCVLTTSGVEAGWIVSALQQISEMHNGFHLPLPVDRLLQDSETPMCVRNKFHLPSICDSGAKQVMLQSCEMWWWHVSKLICNVRSRSVWLTAGDMWIWMREVGCSFSWEQNVERKKPGSIH